MDTSLKLIVESLLFASGEPLTPRQIRDLLPGKDLKEIKEVLKELKDEYETMKRSFLIKEVAEGYQFRSLPKFRPYIANMLISTQSRLSKAALETLTIIAYKQPIIRQEIERLRGVEVGGILKMLLKKGLIRIVGRKSLPGRPIIYGTTKKFLEVFDLKDLSSLPTLKEIEELGNGEEE
ncbi:MAG: SMC-Scp complex subunit ScpB [Deltaproteobacteria bacterium]|jgi:segregation and condensation protein B|nr:MAG: SMC-Scp complex subunit ScpB [Deltaproteobacteria bacterium]